MPQEKNRMGKKRIRIKKCDWSFWWLTPIIFWLKHLFEFHNLNSYPIFTTSKKEKEAIRLNAARLNRTETNNIANFSLNFILSSNLHFHSHICIDVFHPKKVYYYYKINWIFIFGLVKRSISYRVRSHPHGFRITEDLLSSEEKKKF